VLGEGGGGGSVRVSWTDYLGTTNYTCLTCTYIHTYIHTYTHIYTCIHTYIHTHTCIHTYTQTCIHIHTHTHTHTHTVGLMAPPVEYS
jgi:hypothetical protein